MPLLPSATSSGGGQLEEEADKDRQLRSKQQIGRLCNQQVVKVPTNLGDKSALKLLSIFKPLFCN